jgi:hypothetical protein
MTMKISRTWLAAAASLGLLGTAVRAEEPVQFKHKFTLPSGTSTSCETVASVPAGKNLVALFASAKMRPWGSSGLATASQLKIFLGATVAFHELDTQPIAGTTQSRVSQSFRLVAGPGTDVAFCASRLSTADTMDVQVTLAGTLVDIP